MASDCDSCGGCASGGGRGCCVSATCKEIEQSGYRTLMSLWRQSVGRSLLVGDVVVGVSVGKAMWSEVVCDIDSDGGFPEVVGDTDGDMVGSEVVGNGSGEVEGPEMVGEVVGSEVVGDINGVMVGSTVAGDIILGD